MDFVELGVDVSNWESSAILYSRTHPEDRDIFYRALLVSGYLYKQPLEGLLWIPRTHAGNGAISRRMAVPWWFVCRSYLLSHLCLEQLCFPSRMMKCQQSKAGILDRREQSAFVRATHADPTPIQAFSGEHVYSYRADYQDRPCPSYGRWSLE